ncbi:MAG: LysR family transcriptional regulator [Halioglobus sp.]
MMFQVKGFRALISKSPAESQSIYEANSSYRKSFFLFATNVLLSSILWNTDIYLIAATRSLTMRFDKLDLNLLVVLEALIDESSVSAAAERLHLTQPTISASLNRLREYFEDDLLIKSGRKMILSPKAIELEAPVRNALALIRREITNPKTFDPKESKREFVIVASDYSFNVLLGDFMNDCEKQAPGISFTIVPPSKRAMERFQRGEVDLILTVSQYRIEGHPELALLQDEDAVVCCSNGSFRNGISREQFLNAGHVVAQFGEEQSPATMEMQLEKMGLPRRIEVRVPSFSMLPQAVTGTDRVATMHRRQAEYFSQWLPITVHPLPISIPLIEEIAQWHQTQDRDLGVQWLVNQVGKLSTQKAADTDKPKAASKK